MPFSRHPQITLAVAGLITAASLLAITQMRFDYDLLKLQPRGVDSVRWQQRIVDDGVQSIWFAIRVVDSLEQARRVKALLLEQATVSKVGGIGLLFPEDEPEKIHRIEQVHKELAQSLSDALNAQPPAAEDMASSKLTASLQNLYQVVLLAQWWGGQAPASEPSAWRHAWPFRMQAQEDPEEDPQGKDQLASEGEGHQGDLRIRAGLAELAGELYDALNVARSLDDDPREGGRRYARLIEEYHQWRRMVAQRVAAVLDTSPLEPGDVPEELMRPYISHEGPLAGGFALEIHPRLPEGSNVQGPMDPVFLPGFLEDVAVRDEAGGEPFVTGVIVQIFKSGQLIKRSYILAGAYAFGVVLILVWLDFRSLSSAALSLLPVGIGFAVTFGVMWVVGMRVNPANVIVLPLMFGIGVDSGVHMLHRYRQNPKGRPLGLASGTGKGITITSFTTMIGFGAMLMARHRGIASLGFVLTVGIGLTLLSCWTVVPAWLEWRQAGKPREPAG